MNISAKTEYACLAMLELAGNFGSDRPLRIREIAQRHGIPSRFLVQILLQLKGAGFVVSTRGAAGGYRLIRDPAEITLVEVMEVVDGTLGEVRSNATVASPASSTLLETWREVAAAEREMLAAVTFADLAARSRDSSDQMYYI